MRENTALIQSLILTLLVTNTTLYVRSVEFCVCLLVIILNLCVCC